MDASTLIMLAAALLLLIAVYFHSPDSAAKGLRSPLALVIAIAPVNIWGLFQPMCLENSRLISTVTLSLLPGFIPYK